MAAKRGAKGGGSPEMAVEAENVPLQAILLADSFAQTFRPITLERPKVLLPLVNIPMIDYSLECLASAGVEEVFIFCCAHAKQVTSYLNNSSWHSQPKFTISTIESHNCVSAGEALRFMDQRNVVRGDFVLISGDTVSNMSLKEVLEEHRERRKKDKSAIMTMVLKRLKPSPITHHTRLGNDELVLAINPATKQLLYYDDGKDASGTIGSTARQVVLERSIYGDHPAVLLCNDLQVTGNKIFTYEISAEYAARVDNLRGYDSISKDIIHRWTYPMVPDIRFSGNNFGLRIERCNVYRENGVVLPGSAKIGPATVLGEGTTIGERCIIRNSVIGRGCKIGDDVVIEGSYVWNDVTIHKNARLQYALVCDGVVVNSGAVLEPGVVLSFNVVIGQDFIVPSYSKISLFQQPIDEDTSDEELEYVEAANRAGDSLTHPISGEYNATNSHIEGPRAIRALAYEKSEVGVGGAGYRWCLKDGSQDDEWKYSTAPIPIEKLKNLLLEEEQGNLNDSEQDAVLFNGLDKVANSDEEDSSDEDVDMKEEQFDREVEETFKRAAVGNSGVQKDHVILEVNALRLAWNTSFSDCAGALFRAILNLALEKPHKTSKELLSNSKEIILTWKSLLENYLKSEDNEVEVLLKFEEMCLGVAKEFSEIFANVLEFLYDKDIITEKAILVWASEKEGAEESDKVFVRKSAAFITWLKEAEEEEDDD